jgi:hypothetical protein
LEPDIFETLTSSIAALAEADHPPCESGNGAEMASLLGAFAITTPPLDRKPQQLRAATLERLKLRRAGLLAQALAIQENWRKQNEPPASN